MNRIGHTKISSVKMTTSFIYIHFKSLKIDPNDN